MSMFSAASNEKAWARVELSLKCFVAFTVLQILGFIVAPAVVVQLAGGDPPLDMAPDYPAVRLIGLKEIGLCLIYAAIIESRQWSLVLMTVVGRLSVVPFVLWMVLVVGAPVELAGGVVQDVTFAAWTLWAMRGLLAAPPAPPAAAASPGRGGEEVAVPMLALCFRAVLFAAGAIEAVNGLLLLLRPGVVTVSAPAAEPILIPPPPLMRADTGGLPDVWWWSPVHGNLTSLADSVDPLHSGLRSFGLMTTLVGAYQMCIAILATGRGQGEFLFRSRVAIAALTHHTLFSLVTTAYCKHAAPADAAATTTMALPRAPPFHLPLSVALATIYFLAEDEYKKRVRAKEAEADAEEDRSLGPKGAFFKRVSKAIKAHGCLGHMPVVGIERDADEEDDDEEEDDEEEEYTAEQVASLRVILINSGRAAALENALEFATCGQAGDSDFAMFDTQSGNEVCFELPDEIRERLDPSQALPAQFDELFGLTYQLMQYDYWMTDNECWEPGDALEKAIGKLGRAWRGLLRHSDGDLGIDAAFTRPGIEALLAQLEAKLLDCEVTERYPFRWRPHGGKGEEEDDKDDETDDEEESEEEGQWVREERHRP